MYTFAHHLASPRTLVDALPIANRRPWKTSERSKDPLKKKRKKGKKGKKLRVGPIKHDFDSHTGLRFVPTSPPNIRLPAMVHVAFFHFNYLEVSTKQTQVVGRIGNSIVFVVPPYASHDGATTLVSYRRGCLPAYYYSDYGAC